MEKLIERLENLENENYSLFNLVGYGVIILSFLLGTIAVIYAITH